MTDQERRQLRRANTIVPGLLLRAQFAKNREEAKQILCEALLTYALLDFSD